MTVFKDIEIEWTGQKYLIEGARRFGLICLVEDEITISEVSEMALDPTRLKATAIARGFAVILRFLGVTEVREGRTVPITAETVFARMFGDESGTDSPLMGALVLLALVQPDGPVLAEVKPVSKRKPQVKRGNG